PDGAASDEERLGGADAFARPAVSGRRVPSAERTPDAAEPPVIAELPIDDVEVGSLLGATKVQAHGSPRSCAGFRLDICSIASAAKPLRVMAARNSPKPSGGGGFPC